MLEEMLSGYTGVPNTSMTADNFARNCALNHVSTKFRVTGYHQIVDYLILSRQRRIYEEESVYPLLHFCLSSCACVRPELFGVIWGA